MIERNSFKTVNSKMPRIRNNNFIFSNYETMANSLGATKFERGRLIGEKEFNYGFNILKSALHLEQPQSYGTVCLVESLFSGNQFLVGLTSIVYD